VSFIGGRRGNFEYQRSSILQGLRETSYTVRNNITKTAILTDSTFYMLLIALLTIWSLHSNSVSYCGVGS